MIKVGMIVAALTLPVVAHADYDVERIKAGLQASDVLQITGWHIIEAGNVWEPDTNHPKMAFGISDKESGVVIMVDDKAAALSGFAACVTLGISAISPNSKTQKDSILDTIIGSMESAPSKKTVTLNGVIFSAETLDTGANYAAISCLASPL